MAAATAVPYDVTVSAAIKIWFNDGWEYRGGDFQKGVSRFGYPSHLMEKMDITPPEQFIDLKALMGDQVNNIPVTKIGEKKTGLKLLLEYGSLENLYENIDQLKASRWRSDQWQGQGAFIKA